MGIGVLCWLLKGGFNRWTPASVFSALDPGQSVSRRATGLALPETVH